MKALLLKERQEKLQLEMQLRDEICSEMVEQMQQREQWCRYQLKKQTLFVCHLDQWWEVGTSMVLCLKMSSMFTPHNLHSLHFSPLTVNIWTPKRNY